MNDKIKKAIHKGDLIPLEKIMARYSEPERRQIEERARYMMLAMEIRRLRKNLKLSQQGLAEKMSVKRETIARIESGQQNVTMETLYQVAAATNKSLQVEFR